MRVYGVCPRRPNIYLQKSRGIESREVDERISKPVQSDGIGENGRHEEDMLE